MHHRTPPRSENTPRRAAWRLGACAVALTFFSGCRLTPEKALEMRQEQDPESLDENLKRLVAYVAPDAKDEAGDACTRAVAFESAVAITRARQAKTAHPEEYRALVDALRAEARAPRISPESKDPREDAAYLRGFAAHCLGELDDPTQVDFFVDLAASPDNKKDPSRRVEVAALGALAGRTDEIAAVQPLRKKLLTEINEAPWRGADAQPQAAADVDRLARFLYGKLRSLPVLTELLLAYERGAPDERAVLDLLARDYQLLRYSISSGATLTADAYRENIEVVLRFSRDQRKAVSASAESIALEVAPYSLYRDLAARARGAPRTSQKELEDLARMTPVMAELVDGYQRAKPLGVYSSFRGAPLLNEADLVTATPFPDLRSAVQSAIFEFLATTSAPRREFLYGEVAGYDPLALADFLVFRAGATRKEPEPEARQYVRVLGNLIETGSLKGAPARRPKAVDALAAMVGYESKAVRDEVATRLVDGETVALARALVPIVGSLEKCSPDDALDFVAIFAACATRLKEPDPGVILPPALLSHAITRPEPQVREAAVRFLLDRSPELAARLLAARVGEVAPRKVGADLHLLTLLGDVLVSARPRLSPEAVLACVKSLAASLPNLDEERALHAVRYLSDSREPAAKEAIAAYAKTTACVWPAVKTLAEAATR